MPTSHIEARSIKWLVEISTDPEVGLAAGGIVPQLEWPLDLDVSDMLPQLVNIFTSCVDVRGNIAPSLEEKASACATALTHLYYGRVLQAYPDHGEFIIRKGQDVDVFYQIYQHMGTANQTVLDMTANFCDPHIDRYRWSIDISEGCPDSIYERLSHLLLITL
ncbi:hypothetical protein EV424DRAFT_980898 [Suillus variegatus]|nr:hypothetical protein EV424DRAFT_980898 [Suillus variegatus]